MNRVRVKICGVTTPADAIHALDCGADALGLNFYSKSPRYLTEQRAAELLTELPPFAVNVGVVVDLAFSSALELAHRLGLAAIQSYDPAALGQPSSPVRHLPAFRIANAEQLQQLSLQLEELRQLNRLPTGILIDSYVPGEMGGTGHKAPWELLAGFQSPVPLILAGGLTPDNVVQAIEVVRPWGVDVASGVESAPGRKDPQRVRAFMQAVRSMTA